MHERPRSMQASAGNWLCAALLLLLFAEWLRPLYAIPELTEMYQVAPFMTAIGGFLLLHVLGVPFLWSMLLHGLIMAGVISYFFHGMWLWDPSWWGMYSARIGSDMQAVLSGRWAELSGENRTVLFLVGWGMILYAVYTIMAVRRQTAWFVMATLLYLFLMQGWAGIDTTWGIVRAAAAGMLLQMILTVSRSLRRQGGAVGDFTASPRIELSGRWVAAASIATCVWLLAALLLSPDKPESLTKLPFPKTAFTSGAEFSPEARTGYKGRSDQLGLPVNPDPSVAFTATSEQPSYWRGDVKYEYTGSGWREPANKADSPGHVNLAGISADGEGRGQQTAARIPAGGADEQVQEVWFEDPGLYGEWFSGGPIVHIDETTGENGEAVDREERFAHYKIRSIVPPGPGRIASSSGTEQDGWRNLPLEDERQAERREREKLLALQLPSGVPARIADLAASIVGEERDSLQAATLVRDYLRREYAYTMSETTRPAKGADFVEHFLFVQKQGYCDHFSTAMTVMLRTIGVPARWVKGYAPGEITGVEEGMLEITVRQSDAHSWVEVWDERWGWVPFEPTPAYAADLAPEPVSGQGLAVAPASAQVREPATRGEALPSIPLVMMAVGYWFLRAVNAAGSWNWWLLFGLTGTGGMVLVVLAKGAAWLHRLRSRKLPASPMLADSREALQEQWLDLERKHGGRRPAETLLEFSRRIPTASQQERKRWVGLAERLYRYMYQDTSRPPN